MNTPTLTALPGSAPAGADWVTVAAIDARAKHDAEVAIRNYTQSPKQSPDKGYDDRLHVRLNCGKTRAYDLLRAYAEGREGGLPHHRIGNKYIVTERTIQAWEEEVKGQALMRISYRQAA